MNDREKYPPPILGGQGRSNESIRADACFVWGAIAVGGVLFLALVVSVIIGVVG